MIIFEMMIKYGLNLKGKSCDIFRLLFVGSNEGELSFTCAARCSLWHREEPDLPAYCMCKDAVTRASV